MGRKRNYESKRYELLQSIQSMPKLKHSFENKNFEINDSEVIQWLKSNDNIMMFLWDEILLINQKLKFMWYNPQTKTWQGLKYTQEHLDEF